MGGFLFIKILFSVYILFRIAPYNKTIEAKGSESMNKKSIIAGIVGIMMLSAVPAFAATHHNDGHNDHEIHHHATAIEHFNKEVPPPHKDVKPAPPKKVEKHDPPKDHEPAPAHKK